MPPPDERGRPPGAGDDLSHDEHMDGGYVTSRMPHSADDHGQAAPRRLQRSRRRGWRKPHGRDDAVRLHREALPGGTLVNRLGKPITVADVRRELASRELVCFCAPSELCHADTLLEIAGGGS